MVEHKQMSYNQVSQNERTDLLNTRLVVAATVRSCADKIKDDVANLSLALSLFRDVHWFIVESDSTDSTVQVLKELSEMLPNFSYVSLGQLESELPLRTQRIAHCRNRYLEEIRSNPTLSASGLLVVADLDGAQSLVTKEGVMSCFARDEWGACTANQGGLYYDIWALRHPVWSPNDCWEQSAFLQANQVSADKARYSSVYSRMIEIPLHSDWIEVESAFGGLGIYKMQYIGTASYVGVRQGGVMGGQSCEHVHFHQSIRSNGARLFINPMMVNNSINEHSQLALVLDDLTFPLALKGEQERDIESDSGTKVGQLSVMSMTSEDIIAAYKVFLKRHPESPSVVQPRVGMTSDMVLVDFLTSAEFLNRIGVEKLLSLMLNKFPTEKIPIDFLTNTKFLDREDVISILSKMYGDMKTRTMSLELLTSREFLAQDGIDVLLLSMIEKYLKNKQDEGNHSFLHGFQK